MSVVQRVVEAGGFVTRAVLVDATSRAAVDAALAQGDIVADGRGRYATPATDEAVRAAHRLTGVLALTSAALHHGWEVRTLPERPHVVVPRNRNVSAARRADVHLHYADLDPADITDTIVTGVEATLRSCLSQLSRSEALAIADSALRHGVPPATLRRAALGVRGPGAPQARFVAARADGRAANPFESALREITFDVPGLSVRAQVTIHGSVTTRPDLVDEDLEIVLEADSFAWHGGREQLAADARRYNLLVADGWVVLRFAWEDVMHDPDYVRSVLVAAVRLVQQRAGLPCARCGIA